MKKIIYFILLLPMFVGTEVCAQINQQPEGFPPPPPAEFQPPMGMQPPAYAQPQDGFQPPMEPQPPMDFRQDNRNNIVENSGQMKNGLPNEPLREVVVSPEDKAKQEIANNNYKLSFFTERMNLTLDQLDKAKKISEEDKIKREAMLKSIYMLREQSRELEQKSMEKFKELLDQEQLVVFENLRKEQLKYRENYDVMDNVKGFVSNNNLDIENADKMFEEEMRKNEEQNNFEQEAKRRREEFIRRGGMRRKHGNR